MIRCTCDKCGKEIDPEGVEERRMYIKLFTGAFVRRDYCPECKEIVLEALGMNDDKQEEECRE